MTSVSRPDVMVIVDDTSSMFRFDSSRWSADNVSSRWYRTTSMHASKASVASGRPASFNLSFYGTSVAISGGSRIENSPTFSVSIDSQQFSSLAYSEMAAIDTRWYTSQTLPDQLHQLTVSGLDKVVVDYAIITPGQSTPLLGSTIAVDDNSPDITYHGNWKEETGRMFNTTSELIVRPLRSTTHTSSTVGDYFVFQFAGTSVAVYGFLPLKVPGYFAATFTVDDDVPTPMKFPPLDRHFDALRLMQPHFPFYQSPNLTSGNHTLVVNVTDLVGDQSFIVDHLTYTASFSRLSEMPGFSISSGSPNSTASSTPSGQSSKDRIGVIAGGVVGGVFALVVIFATVFLLIRRRQTDERRKSQDLIAKPFLQSGAAAHSESFHQELRLPNTLSSQGLGNFKPLSPGASEIPSDSTHDVTMASPTSGIDGIVRQMEVQQRLDQITLLESRIEEAARHSSVDVDALYAEIDRLRRDNERLERGYQPPPPYAKAIGSKRTGRSVKHRVPGP